MALKCADICNPCRPWELSKQWSEKVTEEFFQQGYLFFLLPAVYILFVIFLQLLYFINLIHSIIIEHIIAHILIIFCYAF